MGCGGGTEGHGGTGDLLEGSKKFYGSVSIVAVAYRPSGKCSMEVS
jgi:hypothetical protein